MKRRNRGAATVLRKSRCLLGLSVLFFGLLTTDQAYALSSQDLSKITKTFFGDDVKTRKCHTLKTTLKEGVNAIDPELNKIVEDLKLAFKKGDAKKIRPLFHPRLNTPLSGIQEVIARQKNSLKLPFEVSLYRAWILNTPEGRPSPLDCDAGEIKLWPHYGYELQVPMWLQILGQKEIGRIYVSFIQHQEKWVIGGMHYHQWTHIGDNYENWFQKARKDLDEGFGPSAYIKFDLTAKLVGGAQFFELSIKDQIEQFQQSLLDKNLWEGSFKAFFKDHRPLVYTSSIFAQGGAGLLLHFQVEKELTTKEIQEDCMDAAKLLNKEKWFQKIDGIKCNYVFKGADPTKEGRLGGVFVFSKDVI